MTLPQRFRSRPFRAVLVCLLFLHSASLFIAQEPPDTDPGTRADAVLAEATELFKAGDENSLAAARTKFREALELFRAMKDEERTAVTLDNIARARSGLGDYEAAFSDLERARTLFLKLGDRRGLVRVLNNTAVMLQETGRFEEALAAAERLGEDEHAVIILSNIGNIHRQSGRAVLATLWPVADESTALLMSEFYRLRRERPGLTKARAMQEAQRVMIEGGLRRSGGTGDEKRAEVFRPAGENAAGPPFETDGRRPFAHPYYWAPFVIYGNWR